MMSLFLASGKACHRHEVMPAIFGQEKEVPEVKEDEKLSLIEVKSIERASSPWSRRTADITGWDERRTTEANSRYNVAPQLASERATPKGVEQISMQDINRYQFRRNRSSDAGLPVVPVGTDKVKTKGSDGN